ncbi:MAG: LytR C-terminal domain-containing protein [Gaiellaceae bacterium]
MSTPAELLPEGEAAERSPLAAARIQRKLTVEETARRAGLEPEEVEWLEEGRAYRFRTPDAALLASVLYATALDVDHREARAIAGLPVPPAPARYGIGRYVAAAIAAAALLALLFAFVVVPQTQHRTTHRVGVPLPSPWRITVDVLNGGGDINYTRQVASRVGALGYRIARVTKANRFDYPNTAVYFEPGGDAIGQRLARQLGVDARPLPGGRNPRRLVVIAGPPRVG